MHEEEKKIEAKPPEEGEMTPRYQRDMFRDFDEMLDEFRRNLYRDFWAPLPVWRRGRRHWWPRAIEPYMGMREANLDLVDKGKEFEIKVDVPGVPKENLEINITKDGIEISGKASVEKSEEERNYMIRERGYTEIYRKLTFPQEVIPEKATSSLKNGLLEIKVPKKEPTPGGKKHKIEVM